MTEDPSPGGPLARAALQARRAGLLAWTILALGAEPLLRGLLRLPPRGPGVPERVRIGLERLGLTYLKLGQYLAMRFDVLPAEVCRELGRLFESIAPMPFAVARAVLERELGGRLEDHFAEFDPEPIAAASVGQVHAARLRSGERVAVKIQRVGIERVFHADIANLRRLMRLVDAAHLLGRLSAVEMLGEFARWTLKEVDFVLEGRTAERVRERSSAHEVIPRVHWELTTSRVLTLEFIEAVSLAQLGNLVDEGGHELVARLHPGIDLDAVLHHMVAASLRQIFVSGLFHGDPHPGNILVLPDSRVAFIDFGIFGELSALDREILAGQLENLATGNVDESLRAYCRQLTATDESDELAFRREARRTLDDWYGVSLRADVPIPERHVGRYIGRMIDISRRHRLRYDMGYLLYWRALNALHSTCLRLASGFDLVADLRLFFDEVRPSGRERATRAVSDRRTWLAAAGVAGSLPRPPRPGRRGAVRPVRRSSDTRARALDRQARRLGAALAAVSVVVALTRWLHVAG